MTSTIALLEDELADGGLIRRWTGAEDGAFITASFWLAECHARAARLDRAHEVFEQAAGTANDLGLLAEDRASEHPRREVFVGGSTVATILGNRLAPWIADRYLARTAAAGRRRLAWHLRPRGHPPLLCLGADEAAHAARRGRARGAGGWAAGVAPALRRQCVAPRGFAAGGRGGSRGMRCA